VLFNLITTNKYKYNIMHLILWKNYGRRPHLTTIIIFKNTTVIPVCLNSKAFTLWKQDVSGSLKSILQKPNYKRHKYVGERVSTFRKMSTPLVGGRKWSTLVILWLSLYSDDKDNIANVVIIFFSKIDFLLLHTRKEGEKS